MSWVPAVQCAEFDGLVHQLPGGKTKPLSENGLEAIRDLVENIVTSNRDQSDVIVIRPRENFSITAKQATDLKKWIMSTRKWQVDESVGGKSIVIKKPYNGKFCEIQLVGSDSCFATKTIKKKVSIREENNLNFSYDSQSQSLVSQSQSQGLLSQLWGADASDEKYEHALELLLKPAGK